MFILHHFFNQHAYALFDVSLRRQASMTQAEKFRTLFAQELTLICSIIWLEWMLRVVLRVLFFVDMRLPRIQVSLICIV